MQRKTTFLKSSVHWLWLVGFVLAFSACRKADELDVAIQEVPFPLSGKIRGVEAYPGGYVFVGGDYEGNGFVVSSDQSLSNFVLHKTDFNMPIYSVAYTPERFIFGTDSAYIIYSENLDDFYRHGFLERNWTNNQYKLPLRRIVIDDASKTWMISGGGGFQFGLVYASTDSARTWNLTEFPNEIHAVTHFDKGAVAVGNGIVTTSANAGQSWQRQRLDNVMLTGVANNWCLGFDGTFYQANADYSQFDELETDDRVRHLTRLEAINHNQYAYVAIGKLGNLAFVDRTGGVEAGRINGTEIEYTDVLLYNSTQVLITADNGRLFLVDLPK